MKKSLITICFGMMFFLAGCQKSDNEFVGKPIDLFSDAMEPHFHIERVKIELPEKEPLEIKTFEDIIVSLNMEESLYGYVLEGSDEINYGYYDVNNDGVDELVFNSVRGVKIFMYLNDEIKMVCDEPYSMLLENGIVWYYRPGSAPKHDYYQALALEETEYQTTITFSRYDDDQDGHFSEDGNGDKYFYNDEEISKMDWEELIQPYLECQEAELHGTGVIVNNFYK